jgi:hypothetical protein
MSPLALFLCTHLPRLQRWAHGHRCSAVCADLFENGLLVVQEALHRLTEVLDEVKTIGNLHGIRGTACRAININIATIPADHRDAGMPPKPCCDGVGRAIREKIDRAMLFEVTDDRAVARPFAPCPVVDAEDARVSRRRTRCRTDETKDRRTARGHAKRACEACAWSPAEREADACKRCTHAMTGTSTGGGKDGKAFAKRLARAAGIAAKEAAGMDEQRNGVPSAGKIGDAPLIAAMDASREGGADRTQGGPLRRGRDDGETVAVGIALLEAEPAQLGKPTREQHETLLHEAPAVRRSVVFHSVSDSPPLWMSRMSWLSVFSTP